MANTPIAKASAKISLDARDLMSETKNALQNAQQVANKTKIQIDVNLNTDELRNQISIYEKELCELNKLKKDFVSKTDKNLLLANTEVKLGDVQDRYTQGDASERDLVFATQRYLASGHKAKELNAEIIDEYQSLSHIDSFIPIDNITSLDNLIASTENKLKSLQNSLKGNKEKISEDNFLTGATTDLNEIKESINVIQNTLFDMQKQLAEVPANSGFQVLTEQADALKKAIDAITESLRIMMTNYYLPNEFYSIANKGEGYNLSSIQYHGGDLSALDKNGYRKSKNLEDMFFNKNEFGAYGTGTYLTHSLEQIRNFVSLQSQYYAIDTSKYNLYITETEEQAKKLFDFLQTLQLFCMKTSGLNIPDIDKIDISSVTPESLFADYQSFYKKAKLNFDEFSQFLNEMNKLLLNCGFSTNEKGISTVADKYKNVDNIATQFMKKNGYEGVDVSKAGGIQSGTTHGSVIYDLNAKKSIVREMKSIEEATIFENKLNEYLSKKNGTQSITTNVDALNQSLSHLVSLLQELKSIDISNLDVQNTNSNSKNQRFDTNIVSYKEPKTDINEKTNSLNVEKSESVNLSNSLIELAKAKEIASQENEKLGGVAQKTAEQLKQEKQAADDLAISLEDIKQREQLTEQGNSANTQFNSKANMRSQQHEKRRKESQSRQEQNDTNRQKQANVLLKQQRDIYKQILDVSNQIAVRGQSTDNTTLKNRKKQLSEQYLVLQKQLRAYDDIVDRNKQFNALNKISRQTNKNRYIPATDATNIIKNWKVKNTAISKDLERQLDALLVRLHAMDGAMDASDIVSEFNRIKAAARDAGETGLSFFDKCKKKMSSLATYLATFVSFYQIFDFVRAGINTIINLDDALIDVNKTFKGSNAELEEMYVNSNRLAKQLGVTTQSVLEQEASWARAGYNTKEQAEEMAKMSSMFASISPDIDTSETDTGLVSIMKAFDIDTTDVKREILDNINEIGNSFAVTNGDILTGLEKSSASMAAIGEDINDTIALFTAGQEILQDADIMGNALRSITMRVRGYSEETEELSEDLVNIKGEVADLTKTASDPNGISLFTDASQQHYKTMVQYLGEISDIWDELSEKQQTDLLQKLFGKTRAQAGAAIIRNFDTVRESLKTMEDAEGSADKEMDNIRKSISYNLNELKETWTGVWQELVDRGDIVTVIKLLTRLSEAIAAIVDKTGGIGLAGLIGGAVAGAKGHRLTYVTYQQFTSPLLHTDI